MAVVVALFLVSDFPLGLYHIIKHIHNIGIIILMVLKVSSDIIELC